MKTKTLIRKELVKLLSQIEQEDIEVTGMERINNISPIMWDDDGTVIPPHLLDVDLRIRFIPKEAKK